MFLIIIKPFSRNFAKTHGSWVVSPLLTLFLRWHQRPRDLENQRTRELEIFLNLENLQLYRVNFVSSSYTNTKFYFFRYYIRFISIFFQQSCFFHILNGFIFSFITWKLTFLFFTFFQNFTGNEIVVCIIKNRSYKMWL